jgi:hypothetical protein
LSPAALVPVPNEEAFAPPATAVLPTAVLALPVAFEAVPSATPKPPEDSALVPIAMLLGRAVLA